MFKGLVYWVVVANFMFLLSIILGATIGVTIIHVFDVVDEYDRIFIYSNCTFNVFVLWVWFSKTARKVVLEVLEHK